MPSGYYVYCRAWLGFTDGFPFFDELNPYSDDKIVPEIELRALTWLRSNKPQVRKAYREERTRLQEVFSKLLPGEAVQPGSSPLTRKLTARLDTLSSEELTQLAEKLQVESRGSKTQIWRALFETLHARLSNPESRGPTIDLLPPSFGLFSFPEPERLTTQVKRAMRGERSNPLAVRITRLARWTDETVRRLGGLSRTRTLYLGWLENEELARQVLEACRLRSQSIGWDEHPRLKFGRVPVEILGVDRAAAIEMDLKELQNRNDRWEGTTIHQAVHREYIQVVAEVCTVGLRGDPPAESTKRAAVPLSPTVGSAWDELPDRVLAACSSYRIAEQRMDPPAKTDREAYEWLEEHSELTEGYTLPSFETWTRYLRDGRQKIGEQKNRPRSGRSAGSSIVSQDVVGTPRDFRN